MGIFTKLFGTYSERELKKIDKTVCLVETLAEKYGKTPAQICLRFCLQNNILPLPKSSSPERMKQNLELFDFDIELEDIFRLMTMPETGWSGQHPEHF